MPVIIGATGLNFSIAPTEITLAGAQALLIPSGQYIATVGRYSLIEWYDSNANLWRNFGNVAGRQHSLVSDGTNFRLINRTGCPVGAVMTNVGSGYTSAPTVTSSAGGSLWRAIVGGSINTTVTVTTAGAYNYVPNITFSPPPSGGIAASGYVTLSSGAISSVTVTNAGAGYTTAPTITITQDPRDTAAGGGVLTVNSTLANSGAVTAVVCTDPGSAAVTSLPTLTFTGGGGSSAAATVVMNWTVTGITVGTAGAGYGTSAAFAVTGADLKSAATAAAGFVNPDVSTGLVIPRNFWVSGTSTAGGALTATGAVIEDAGFGIQKVPNAIVETSALYTTAGAVTVSVGATVDTSFLQQIKV